MQPKALWWPSIYLYFHQTAHSQLMIIYINTLLCTHVLHSELFVNSKKEICDLKLLQFVVLLGNKTRIYNFDGLKLTQ